MFWYYVLASRIDDGQAWSAAVRWTGDSMVTSTGAASQCVDAKVAAADPDGAAVLLAAFPSWAAAAPAESATTVVPIEGNQVAIRACDPGAAVTAQLPVKVPVAFGGAGVERALVQAAVSAGRHRQGRRGMPRQRRPSARRRPDLAGRRRAGAGRRTGSRRTSPPTSTWQPDASPHPWRSSRRLSQRWLSRGSSGTAAGCRGRRPSAWR